MDLANNPVEGTGFSVDEAAKNIESILDTDTGTTEEVDADNETVEVSNTETVDEIDGEAEQSLEDSDEVTDETETEEVQAEDTDSSKLAQLEDDALVDIDGKQIPWSEAKKQMMLHADYTRKRQQETAELKQHMARYQVQQVEMADMRVAVTNDITEMKRRIATELTLESFNPPDDSLYEVDPYEHGRKTLEYQRKQAAVKELYEAERLLAEQNIRWEKEQHALRQAAALEEFSAKHVEFADKQKAPALLNELGQFLSDNGFGREEIEGIADARIMDIVYRLYRSEVVAKQVPHAVKALEKRAQAVSPGTSRGASTTENGFQKDAQKYKRTGDFNDAVSAISKLL